MADIGQQQTNHVSAETAQAPPQRKKLNLKPRNPDAAARIEKERQQSSGKSPFGAAKPREVVIATRVGKTEEDVLKEEVKKEKLHLRLNPAQLEERKSHEAAVKEIEDQIGAETDEKKKDILKVELAARQSKLDALMDRFVKMTIENAKSGEAPRMSHIRKSHAPQDHHHGPIPPPGYNQRYNPTQQYAGGHRGGHRGGSYGGRSGYVPVHGGQPVQRGGGSGGRGGRYNEIPEWAKEEYVNMGNQVQASAIDAEANFYDYGSAPGSHAGRGRGRRGRGREHSAFYKGPFPGRGVGGEIEFDSFTTQDRY
jgi:hypothetical protein